MATIEVAEHAAATPSSGPRPTPGAGSRRQRSGARRVLLAIRPWLSVVAIVVVWHLADVAGALDDRILPGPTAVGEAAAGLVVDGRLVDALAASLPRVVIGLTLGVSIGTLLGLVSGYWRLGEDIVDRPMQMVRAVPFTALTPLFILWFGIDELPKIMLVLVGTAVPLYINTFAGIRNVDRRLVEVALVYDPRPASIATRVLLPGALPQILTGLRYGLGIGWVALIVAETMAASSGIGFLLTTARQYSETDVVIVCIVLYAMLGVITDLLVRWLEAWLLRWRVANRP